MRIMYYSNAQNHNEMYYSNAQYHYEMYYLMPKAVMTPGQGSGLIILD